MSGKIITTPGKRYHTINSCLVAYFGCKAEELDALEGNFVTRTADGVDISTPVQEALRNIRKKRVWGWVESKEFIHYFVRKSATMLDLVAFFAHELGHMERPFHRSVEEERKAERYAEVAYGAFQLAQQVFEDV